MKNLPKLIDLDIRGKIVLVRVDLDYKDDDGRTKRQEIILPTLDFLVGKASEIILLGHRGRPGGKTDESLSLKPTADKLEDFLKERWGEERVKNISMYLMENLRFNPGEESNDEHYAKHLAEEGDCYVNEAFASSHRRHASIVGLPSFLPHAAGFHFVKEVENLSKVFNPPAGGPKRPLVSIISGVKEDKLSYVEDFKKIADRVLIGGRLPEFLNLNLDSKLIVANLTSDKRDISAESIELFENEITKAGTIVVSGPMGKFEEEDSRQGTERILKKVANSNAFKVAGGGDTERAISIFGLSDRFDWISVGGGAMLEFLSKGTLPGIEALQ